MAAPAPTTPPRCIGSLTCPAPPTARAYGTLGGITKHRNVCDGHWDAFSPTAHWCGLNDDCRPLGRTEALEGGMMGFEALVARQRALRAQIAARADAAPNRRDYGLDRRDEYEQAIGAYHAETARLRAEMEEVAVARRAAWVAR